MLMTAAHRESTDRLLYLAFPSPNNYVPYQPAWPLYKKNNVDASWSCEVWRGVSNRYVQHIVFERCGLVVSIMPCMGYVVIGNELFATAPRNLKIAAGGRRQSAIVDDNSVAVTTIWQHLMNHHALADFDLRLRRVRDTAMNMYLLQLQFPGCRSNPIWLERISFVNDVSRAFRCVRRFLARRAILRKIKTRHFTKLAQFIKWLTVSTNPQWRAIHDTGVFGECIVHSYLGLTSSSSSPPLLLPFEHAIICTGNCKLKLRGEKLVKTKGRMQFS